MLFSFRQNISTFCLQNSDFIGVFSIRPAWDAYGSSASHIYLRLLLPNGTLQEYDITAPAMKIGGKYEMRLNYNQMQPKMNLEATINGWTNLNNEVEIK